MFQELLSSNFTEFTDRPESECGDCWVRVARFGEEDAEEGECVAAEERFGDAGEFGEDVCGFFTCRMVVGELERRCDLDERFTQPGHDERRVLLADAADEVDADETVVGDIVVDGEEDGGEVFGLREEHVKVAALQCG